MARLGRALILLLLIAGVGVWASMWWREQSTQTDASGSVGVPGGVQIGGPFSLVAPDGRTVTDADFRGKVMLVYFGYTYCPDVCPTELQAVAASLSLMGNDASRIAPVFVTIDPERDTPKAMGEYTKLFDDRILGLTGSAAQIAAIAKEYRVYYAKAESKDASTYLMDHSSFMYVMGPAGDFRALIKPGAKPAEIADILRAQLPRS
jgi:cytochrome oxidase Cu insertion factor (SCO1/SenC/PrrC family)